LLDLRWWNYGLSALGGADFTDIGHALGAIERNIAAGTAQPYQGPLVRIGADGAATLWRYDRERNMLVAVD
jgi:hypothetical protein